MKYYLLFLPLFTFLFTQPALANKAMPESLVGQWKYDGEENDRFPVVYRFNNDGTFSAAGAWSSTDNPRNERIVCVLNANGIITSVEKTGDKQETLTSDKISVALLYPAPGATSAQCEAMVKALNVSPLSFTLPITEVDYKTIKTYILGGYNVTFHRYVGG